MKEKEVPQDNEGLFEGKLREMCYAVDETGNYVTVLSTGWDPKNAALKQAWSDINEKIESTRKQVLAGELSPLAYYMEKTIMDVGLLAKYSGIKKWKVKRHLKPGNFARLSENDLKKYAQALDVKEDELKNFISNANQNL
jgi:hypothetical protein